MPSEAKCGIVLVMETKIEVIPSGSVTSPEGFYSGAVNANIKKEAIDRLDLAILFSEASCTAAALFTKNKIQAAPVVLSRERLENGRAVAVVVNSGCANACTGKQGMGDATEVADMAAKSLGVSSEDVLVASTGVIGMSLPMERLRDGMGRVVLSPDGGHELARAILTTDTVPKEIAVRVNEEFIVSGVAKGSGMIHPDLATMLCFLTTDAVVDINTLQQSLKKAADVSFNMLSIDGDTSPNDMALIMANGIANNETITRGSQVEDAFQEALNTVCIYLAKSLARDGEGAYKLIEVTVDGAKNTAEAKLTARTIVNSSLVKAAIHGSDPNWGRIIAAAGRSGAEVLESKIDLEIGGICLVKKGAILAFNREAVVTVLNENEVRIALNLNIRDGTATAWGCDLSEEYVTINSLYTT